MNTQNTAPPSEIRLRNAAGELQCTIAYNSPCAVTAHKEYRPFILCTKGEHAGELVPACGNGPWENEADAQAALEDFMPVLRRKAKKLGLDLTTIKILSRSTVTVQSEWAPDL